MIKPVNLLILALASSLSFSAFAESNNKSTQPAPEVVAPAEAQQAALDYQHEQEKKARQQKDET